MFNLSYDYEFTVRRFAMSSLIVIFWLWLAVPLSFFHLYIAYLIPNPYGFYFTLFGLTYGTWGNWGLLYPLIMLFLQVNQTVAAISLGLILWRRYAGTGPMADQLGKPLDTERLKRPWFITPVFIVVWTVMFCYLIAMLVLSIINMVEQAYEITMPLTMMAASFWPLVVGLGISGIGLLSAWPRIAGAQNFLQSMNGIKTLADDHVLTRRVHELAKRLDLPPPKVAVTAFPNAFAVGMKRDQALVILGVPLVQKLTPPELDAVIGHELGHIISGDMQQMQFAEGFQTAMSDMIGRTGQNMTRQLATTQLGAVTGNLWSEVMRRTVLLGGEFAVKGLSRSREFYADAIGAAVTSPEAMASALDKLQSITTAPTPIEQQYACLMFRGAVGRFLATHPPIPDRIAALKSRVYLDQLPRHEI